MINPLPIGTVYDGRRIVEVEGSDPKDPYQPYMYRLDDGERVWIPADYYPELLSQSQPKHVGTWVLAVLDCNELVKWGKDGDTEFPYPPDDQEAVEQAKYL